MLLILVDLLFVVFAVSSFENHEISIFAITLCPKYQIVYIVFFRWSVNRTDSSLAWTLTKHIVLSVISVGPFLSLSPFHCRCFHHLFFKLSISSNRQILLALCELWRMSLDSERLAKHIFFSLYHFIHCIYYVHIATTTTINNNKKKMVFYNTDDQIFYTCMCAHKRETRIFFQSLFGRIKLECEVYTHIDKK